MLRVIHLPELVGNNPIGLSKAECEIGLVSSTVALRAHPFGYEPDLVMAKSRIAAEASRVRLVRYLIENADVAHFNFGQSCMPSLATPDRGGRAERFARHAYNIYARCLQLRDVPYLKSRGVGVVVTFQGDDARMGSLDPNLVSLTEGGYYTKKGDDIKKRRIDFWAEQTQQIFALNPDLLKFLPDSAKFLPYASVDPQHYKIYRDRRRAGSKVLRIVHAPTNREVKGTAYVLDAIAKLKLEGFQIELDLVEGKSHLEAIQQYSEADLVIDQVVLGWYGGLAVEAMAMGVPVLGFINNNDLRYVPEEMAQQIPILNADKNSIQNVLRNFILSSPQERQKIAKSSIEFVDKWHDPIKIAQSLIDPYFRAHNEAQNLSQRSR